MFYIMMGKFTKSYQPGNDTESIEHTFFTFYSLRFQQLGDITAAVTMIELKIVNCLQPF